MTKKSGRTKKGKNGLRNKLIGLSIIIILVTFVLFFLHIVAILVPLLCISTFGIILIISLSIVPLSKKRKKETRIDARNRSIKMSISVVFIILLVFMPLMLNVSFYQISIAGDEYNTDEIDYFSDDTYNYDYSDNSSIVYSSTDLPTSGNFHTHTVFLEHTSSTPYIMAGSTETTDVSLLRATWGTQLSINSTSDFDNITGDWALCIILMYLDLDYKIQEEIVNLTGTTPVLTIATDILAIQNFQICDAGDNMVNFGDIEISDVNGTYAIIKATFSKAFMSQYTVPYGFQTTNVLFNLEFSKKTIGIVRMIPVNTTMIITGYVFSESESINKNIPRTLDTGSVVWLECSGKDDIVLTGHVSFILITV